MAVAAAVLALVALGGVIFLPIGNDGDGVSSVEISMFEYAFSPAEMQAHPGQELAISNDGALAHSYYIPELAKGVELGPGQQGTLPLPSDVAAGSYRVICDLPGHVEHGMVGTLVVS